MSDHCRDLFIRILVSIAPQAQPGEISTTSDPEIEECIEISAIALCWHLAATADPIRRDRLTQGLMTETLGLAVCVEAAGIAMQKGITLDEALQEIHDSIGLSQAEEPSNLNQQQAENKTQGRRHHQTDGTTAISAIQCNSSHQGCSRSGRLPPLVLPPSTLMSCRELVVRLIRGIDAEAVPANVTTISDEEIEERARACHSVLCWLLGALSMRNSTRRHQLEGRWLKVVPDLVALTIAVANAENGETTVIQAIREIRGEPIVFGVELLEGKTCVWWQDADGYTQTSGPKDAEEVMKGMARASDFLRAVSDAMGVNVNTLSPDALDQLLSEHHLELAQLAPDGSQFDVSRAEYEAFVERFDNLSDSKMAQLISQCPQAANLTLEQKAWPMRRSYLIRVHMMKAKIEERERRKLILH